VGRSQINGKSGNTAEVNSDGSLSVTLSNVVKSVDIIPNDGADLVSGATKGLYVGVSGNIKMTMADGSVVTRKNVTAGMTHSWSIKRVWATGTTATDIVGDY
jgi:hypothetical protein